MTIQGLIFDFGGVINNMRWDVARELEERHGLERNAIANTLYTSDEWHAVQTGTGDIERWRQAAQQRLEEQAGTALPPLHQQWHESWHPITENIDLIKSLRPQYKISILSNADVSLEDRIRDGMDIHHLFDDVISSAAVGMAKPDAAIYRLAAERLELAPEACLFVDDAKRNTNAAREAGMAAVHYRVDKGDDLAAQFAEHGVRPVA